MVDVSPLVGRSSLLTSSFVSPLVGVIGIGLSSRNTRGRLARCGGECRRSSLLTSSLTSSFVKATTAFRVARFLFGAPGALTTLFLEGGVENGGAAEGRKEAVGGASNDDSFNEADDGDDGDFFDVDDVSAVRLFRCEKCSSSVLCIVGHVDVCLNRGVR